MENVVPSGRRKVLNVIVAFASLWGLVAATPEAGAQASDATTASVVTVGGRRPGLGGFGSPGVSVDLTTAVKVNLGPLMGASFGSTWAAWREPDYSTTAPVDTGASTRPRVAVIFADGRDTADSALISKAIGLGQTQGWKVYVIPAEPELRVADGFRLRQIVTVAGAGYADVGTMAGGRVFEEALADVARQVKSDAVTGKSLGESASAPARIAEPGTVQADSPSAGSVVGESIVHASSPTSATGGVRPGALSASISDQGNVIYMPPPPVMKDFRARRTVPRDPTLQKLPSVAD